MYKFYNQQIVKKDFRLNKKVMKNFILKLHKTAQTRTAKNIA